jgi:hypothetical protein
MKHWPSLSRREIILWLSTLVWITALPQGISFVAQKYARETDTYEQFSHLFWIDEEVKQYLKSPEWAKQNIIDLSLVSFFFWKILPLLKRGKSSDMNYAISLLAPAISSWYALSNDTAKKNLASHSFWAFLTIWWISASNVLGSIYKIDIDQLSAERVSEFFWRDLERIKENQTVQRVLNRFRIKVHDNTKYPSIQESETWKKYIIIPIERFKEILPLIQSETEQIHIPRVVSNFFTNKDSRLESLKISSQYFKNMKKDLYEPIMDTSLKKEIYTLSARMLREEVTNLLIFSLITQFPFAGNAQTHLFKRTIQNLWFKLYHLAIANGAAVETAKSIKNRFEILCISYLFNRTLYFDAFTLTWVLFYNFWEKNESFDIEKRMWRVKSFLDWVLPIVWANIRPFLKNIDRIIYETWVTWEFQDSWKTINDKWWLDYNFTIIKERILSYARDIFISKEWEKFWNWQRQKMISNPQLNSNLRKSIVWFPLLSNLFEFDYESKFFDEIEDLYEGLSIDSKDIKTSKQSFSRFVDLVYFLVISHKNTSQKKIKKTIENTLSRKYNTLLLLYELVKNTSVDNPEKQVFVEHLEEMFFVDKDVWEAEVEEKIFEAFLDTVEHTKEQDAIRNYSIIYDLDFCVVSQSDVFWNIQSTAKMFQRCIRFLRYIEKKKGNKDGIYITLKNIFTSNVKSYFENRRMDNYRGPRKKDEAVIERNKKYVNFVKEELSLILTNSEVFYYNKLFSPNEELYIISLKTRVKNREFKLPFEKQIDLKPFFWPYTKTLDKQLGLLNEYLGRDNADVIKSLLLIQSPFITALVNVLESSLKIPQLHSLEKKHKIFLVSIITYFVSMNHQSYVWFIVWVDLLKKLVPWISTNEAIAEIGKIAVIGWSAAITGRVTNLTLGKHNPIKFYSIDNARSFREKEFQLIWLFGENQWKDMKMIIYRFGAIMWVTEVAIDAIVTTLTPNISQILDFSKPANIWTTVASIIATDKRRNIAVYTSQAVSMILSFPSLVKRFLKR